MSSPGGGGAGGTSASEPLTVDRVVLREVELELVRPFRTRFGSEQTRRVIVVEAHGANRIGYGEVPVLSTPFYHDETLTTAWHVLVDVLLPLARQEPWSGPQELAGVLAEVRRHPMARAGLEGAVWDLEARRREQPLRRLLGAERNAVPAGVSLGLERDLGRLRERVAGCVADGYRRVKLKIEPGWDREPLAAVREDHPELELVADANGAYDRSDTDRLLGVDELELGMLEQPLPAGDLVGSARLQDLLATPICLDESIDGPEAVETMAALGSGRVVSVKAARVGGLSRALAIHAICRRLGLGLCCGGLLESGIGRAHNLALAALPGFTVTGDLSASRRYFAADLIEPEVTVTQDGQIALPSGPGLGYRVDRERLETVTRRQEAFSLR